MLRIMKTCINGATTMPYPLETDVQTASEAGFEAIEVWKAKLDMFLQRHGIDELKRLLSSYGLEVAAICAFSGYVWCPEAEFEKRLEETNRYFDIARRVDCESLIVCAEGFKDRSLNEAVEAHAARLARVADVGEAYGVKVAMEWFWCLKDAFKVIEKADHCFLGMIIDTFHWYRGDGEIRNVDLTPKGKLYVVHVNDCEDLPREKLTDKNRLYCGLGVIPLVEILQKLKRLDYDGPLSVEVFRDEYWKKQPSAISMESLETLRQVMRKASLP